MRAAADALGDAHARLFSDAVAGGDDANRLARNLELGAAIAHAGRRLGHGVERQLLSRGAVEGVEALRPWREEGCFESAEDAAFREYECLGFQALCLRAAARAMSQHGKTSRVVPTHAFWSKVMRAVADPTSPDVFSTFDSVGFARTPGRVARGFALRDGEQILLPVAVVLELMQFKTRGRVCPMACSHDAVLGALSSSFTVCNGCGRAVQLDAVHACPVCLDSVMCTACCRLSKEGTVSAEMLRHHASGECSTSRARVAALRGSLARLRGSTRESALWDVSVGLRLAELTACACDAATALNCCSLSSSLFAGASKGLVEQVLLHRPQLLLAAPRGEDQALVDELGGAPAFERSLWDELVAPALAESPSEAKASGAKASGAKAPGASEAKAPEASEATDAAKERRREKKARRRENQKKRRDAVVVVDAVGEEEEDGEKEEAEGRAEVDDEAVVGADVEADEADEPVPECAFCMDTACDSVIVPCGHVGCYACLAKHTAKDACPVCQCAVGRIVKPR